MTRVNPLSLRHLPVHGTLTSVLAALSVAFDAEPAAPSREHSPDAQADRGGGDPPGAKARVTPPAPRLRKRAGRGKQIA